MEQVIVNAVPTHSDTTQRQSLLVYSNRKVPKSIQYDEVTAPQQIKCYVGQKCQIIPSNSNQMNPTLVMGNKVVSSKELHALHIHNPDSEDDVDHDEIYNLNSQECIKRNVCTGILDRIAKSKLSTNRNVVLPKVTANVSNLGHIRQDCRD